MLLRALSLFFFKKAPFQSEMHQIQERKLCLQQHHSDELQHLLFSKTEIIDNTLSFAALALTATNLLFFSVFECVALIKNNLDGSFVCVCEDVKL